nr:epithelial-stromal interaction protein 1 isoform X2 [Pogona vitticeps]
MMAGGEKHLWKITSLRPKEEREKERSDFRVAEEAFGEESKLKAEERRFSDLLPLRVLLTSVWQFSLPSPAERAKMYGTRAGGGSGSRPDWRAAASSSDSRRYQAGDCFSQGEAARRDARDQETSEGQTPSLGLPEPRLGAHVAVPPNPTRRAQLQRVANKELEDLAKWKEQHKPGPITLTPQKLGGSASEAEVRQKQQLEHIQSKYKKKLKKEEYERIKREAEEADILKKKAIQREKANRLEEKERQQEQQRQQMLEEDHYLQTTKFLNRLDRGSSKRTSCETEHSSLESTAWARSHAHRQIQRQEENRILQRMKEEQRKKAELLALKQRQEERMRIEAHQNEQRRVNNAFLDRLQNNSQPGGIYQSGCLGNMHFSADSWGSEHFY